jgi:hypothetical protein
MLSKGAIKNFLGEMPLTAELYWQLRQSGKPLNKAFSLRKVEKALPGWCEQADIFAQKNRDNDLPKQNILIFSTLRYWIEHTALLGLGFAGLGHQVTFTYLPYANWQKPLNRFDQRRQNLYARNIFQTASPLLNPISLLDVKQTTDNPTPETLHSAIQEISLRDAQYTLQVEEIDCNGDQSASAQLYNFRLERNMQAAGAILSLVHSLKAEQRPDVFVIPNGSILEMGAVFQTARYLDITVVTYEFGEQRDRIWLAKNSEVMLQKTDTLWGAKKDVPLAPAQWEQIKSLFASRQSASLWENFSRKWQGLPSQGGEQVKASLGLDSRPVILLAANVIGDSLTLGRQVFSKNMTDWLDYSVRALAQQENIQFVIRIHPGERFIDGPSVAEVVQNALPKIPNHIHLVEANDPINTYDLVEIADLGLVYTTTVGMEMAMSGVPVVVAGQTHYRGKGFTLDPSNWDAYQNTLDQFIQNPANFELTRQQVEQAWKYAYNFFFEYPCKFPWHLIDFWDELEKWPIERVLSDEGLAAYGETFNYLVGEPRNWN